MHYNVLQKFVVLAAAHFVAALLRRAKDVALNPTSLGSLPPSREVQKLVSENEKPIHAAGQLPSERFEDTAGT